MYKLLSSLHPAAPQLEVLDVAHVGIIPLQAHHLASKVYPNVAQWLRSSHIKAMVRSKSFAYRHYHAFSSRLVVQQKLLVHQVAGSDKSLKCLFTQLVYQFPLVKASQACTLAQAQPSVIGEGDLYLMDSFGSSDAICGLGTIFGLIEEAAPMEATNVFVGNRSRHLLVPLSSAASTNQGQGRTCFALQQGTTFEMFQFRGTALWRVSEK